MIKLHPPFLQAINISKRYGGIEALRDISLDIYPGDVIGVVGDTNSGKSTLLRLIAGGMTPDRGYFNVQHRRQRLAPAYRAARLGIKAVYQEINAAQDMNTLGFIFASQPDSGPAVLRWLGWWNEKRMLALARAEFKRLDFDPPPLNRPLRDLTSAERKMVALVHATIGAPRLLLLDEPMEALEAHKSTIIRMIRAARDQGTAVLLVTQNLEDIFSVADRIVVLNAGNKIAERHTAQTTEEEIVSLILRSVENRLTPAVWALSNYFEVRRQADKLDRLYKALERRAAQLQAHAEVARSATSILDRDKLLTQIVTIIQQRFGYYCTGLYLLDPAGEYAILRSSASRNTQQLDDVTLRVGENGMVGWCAKHGQSRLANDVTQDPLYQAENTLPDTRSELVLPLHIGAQVLGVLDLQSDRLNAFDEEDVQTLQALADQLAIAIRNADLFEAAQRARLQADEANRYKSVVLSNMSHELRTPLSVIIGHTQAMLSSTSDYYPDPLPQDYVRDLETIRRSGAHLLALINDILDLSKIEAGKLRLKQTVLKLKDILDDAVHTAQGLLNGRPIEVHAAYGDDLPPVWGDNVRTRQIALNLLTNALKFTETGSVTVYVSVQQETITVAVQDTGIGIPPHLLENIFERFRQGDTLRSRRFGGTGLGLSISQQLVELQGGRIWVESEVSEGTTVSFTVPRATPEQIAAHIDQPDDTALFDEQRMVIFQATALHAPAPKRLILFAQDNPVNAHIFCEALEAAGYAVEKAPVAALLVEMAEVMLPDAVILDASEPGGPAVLEKLRVAPCMTTIPAIVFTAEEPLTTPSSATLIRTIHKSQVNSARLVALVREYLDAP